MVALSIALISSAVSVRIGGLINLVASSKAANMIPNLAQQVSACETAGVLVWALFYWGCFIWGGVCHED